MRTRAAKTCEAGALRRDLLDGLVDDLSEVLEVRDHLWARGPGIKEHVSRVTSATIPGPREILEAHDHDRLELGHHALIGINAQAHVLGDRFIGGRLATGRLDLTNG
mgnify:CR=1 FL=1